MRIQHRNAHWHTMCADLADGDQRHGISDGRWSLIDLLEGVALEVGREATLYLAVWTASGDHGKRLRAFIEKGLVSEIFLMVDRSFVGRQPKACEQIVDLFGEKNLRVWSSHAKFALFIGGKFDVMLQFSMNLNQNRRLENFSILADAALVSDYLALVDELWALQGSQEGIAVSTSGRRATKTLLASPQKIPSDTVNGGRSFTISSRMREQFTFWAAREKERQK